MGSVVKGIGKAIGGVVKGVAKFASSPIGKTLLSVGAGLLTGGVGGIIGKGLSLLSKSGIGSKVMDVFKGVAGNFLNKASDMVSGSGIGTVGSFLQNLVGGGGGSGGILDTFKNLIGNWAQPTNQAEQATQQAAQENTQQLAAYYQAMALREQQMGQQAFQRQFSPANFY